MGLIAKEQRNFANIIADGTIRTKASEGEKGAVRRDYKLSNGEEGFKYEHVYHEISGYIDEISFWEGEYGKSMHICVNDGDESVVLSVSVQSNFADDIMKKLPNIDFTKEVVFKPYSFEDKETKKMRKGVTIIQGIEKINNYFIDAKKKKATNGFPEPEKSKKEMDNDDWKIYFMKSKKFLQKFIEENVSPLVTSTTYERKKTEAEEDVESYDPKFE